MSTYSMEDIVKSVEIQYITIGTIHLLSCSQNCIAQCYSSVHSLARIIDSAPVGVNIHIFKYSNK